MKDSAEIDVAAAFAHGIAAAPNLQGIVYNARRAAKANAHRKYPKALRWARFVDFDVAMNGVCLAYHLWSAIKHYRRAESYL